MMKKMKNVAGLDPYDTHAYTHTTRAAESMAR